MHKKRIQNLQQLMDKNDVDCLLLFAGVDLFYATNLQIHPSERPTIAIIPQNKEPILLCPGFEEKRMSETAIVSNIETWEEDENPFKKLRAILKSLGFEKSTIALDNKLWYEWYLKIEQQLTDVTFTNSTKIIQEARLIKSEAELNIMRKATEIASKAIISAHQQAEVGMTENQIDEIVKEELIKRGGRPAFCLVQSGKNSALPHGSPTNRKIQRNDVLLIDAGPNYKGYIGDITITSVVGTPSPKFKEIYEVVYTANRAALEYCQEGRTAENVDLKARKVIEQAGYGNYFTHRLGHGIGIEPHEPPYIVKGNSRKLKSGMVHSIEPGIYMEGAFGVRIEDDVVVSKDHCELLYETPRKIWK